MTDDPIYLVHDDPEELLQRAVNSLEYCDIPKFVVEKSGYGYWTLTVYDEREHGVYVKRDMSMVELLVTLADIAEGWETG